MLPNRGRQAFRQWHRLPSCHRALAQSAIHVSPPFGSVCFDSTLFAAILPPGDHATTSCPDCGALATTVHKTLLHRFLAASDCAAQYLKSHGSLTWKTHREGNTGPVNKAVPRTQAGNPAAHAIFLASSASLGVFILSHRLAWVGRGRGPGTGLTLTRESELFVPMYR